MATVTNYVYIHVKLDGSAELSGMLKLDFHSTNYVYNNEHASFQ